MPTALSTETSVRSTGEYVSREYFQFLIDGYSQVHPTEEKSVFIARELIAAALAASPRVCGIRFVYGEEESGSRVVILMSCAEAAGQSKMPSMDEGVGTPKRLLPAEGLLTHAGGKLSMGECATLSEQYLDRMCALWPGESREEMPRSCFFGAVILEDLLAQEDCAGIHFHFGYDAGRERLPLRYAVVLEAVDGVGQSLELFADHGSLCPPNCPPIPPGGLVPGM